jgi:hypothetical protein
MCERIGRVMASTVLKWVHRLFAPERTGKEGEKPGPFARLFTSGERIPLARHDLSFPFLQVSSGPENMHRSGEAALGGKSVAWHEFDWTSEVRDEERVWHEVRWRFYANGLVAFEAVMSNAATGLASGKMMGHAIELRDSTGFLIGVWVTGFYVRRNLPALGYQASLVDDHQPLMLHFGELAPAQRGLWLHI